MNARVGEQLDIHLLNRPDLPSVGAGETPLIAVAPRPFSPRARNYARSKDDVQSGLASMVQENLLINLTILYAAQEAVRDNDIDHALKHVPGIVERALTQAP